MRKFNEKNIMIYTLIISIIILAIGYLNLSNVLGLTYNSNDGKMWNIEITDISLVNKIGNVEEITLPTKTTSTATFNVKFSEVGDKITYKIKIKNKGLIDAKLKEIIQVSSNETDNIKFEISKLYAGNILESGEETYALVTVSYDKKINGNDLTKSETIIFNYVQK